MSRFSIIRNDRQHFHQLFRQLPNSEILELRQSVQEWADAYPVIEPPFSAQDCRESPTKGQHRQSAAPQNPLLRPGHTESRAQRQGVGQTFQGAEEYDFAVDPRTGWRFYKSRGETCRQLRPRELIGINRIENEHLEFQVFFNV